MTDHVIICPKCGASTTVSIANLPGAVVGVDCPGCGERLFLTLEPDAETVQQLDAQPPPLSDNIAHTSTRENTTNE